MFLNFKCYVAVGCRDKNAVRVTFELVSIFFSRCRKRVCGVFEGS